MEAAGLRTDRRWPAAALPVHTGLGLGSAGGDGTDLCRMGPYFDLQEVMVHACADGLYPVAEISRRSGEIPGWQAAELTPPPAFFRLT